MPFNPSNSPRGTVISVSKATFCIYSFTFHFLCYHFFCCFKRIFLECSADLKTRLLFFNSFMRQTNAPYSFSSEQLFMAFTKPFILLQTSFICFNRLDCFLIFFLFCYNAKQIKSFLKQNRFQHPYLFCYWSICW